MRCHITDRDDEMNPPAYNIWTSGTLQTPNILKSILSPSGSDVNCFTEDLCSLDTASPSQKRKLLECEREDFEERFHKIQRRKQLQKVAARANLVVDDDDDDSDDEDKIYQQMDWIEKENALNLRSCDSSSDEDDSLFDDDDDDDKANTPLLFIPRSKWKDERRRLLRISMAKIRGVEDPEAYLRRSVLINNTVKRLQKDAPLNYRCHSLASTSYFQGNVAYQSDSMTSWDASVVCKQQIDSDTFNFDYQYDGLTLRNSHPIDSSSFAVGYSDKPCSLNFHLACASLSSDKKTIEALQRQVMHNNSPSVYDRDSLEEPRLNDMPLPSLVLKQPSPLQVFSSQPCGLQYRNPIHTEDPRDDYHESSSSSILDSVVYHSLIASLET